MLLHVKMLVECLDTSKEFPVVSAEDKDGGVGFDGGEKDAHWSL